MGGWFGTVAIITGALDWAGLANEEDRYLYVNRGFGFLAFSGRLGSWPEITVLTLKRKA
jgi:uncharacterized protein